MLAVSDGSVRLRTVKRTLAAVVVRQLLPSLGWGRSAPGAKARGEEHGVIVLSRARSRKMMQSHPGMAAVWLALRFGSRHGATAPATAAIPSWARCLPSGSLHHRCGALTCIPAILPEHRTNRSETTRKGSPS